ncbi:unnamed protein product [Spirodela intermedia]|uniref:Uncharacterized protein n=1 Tax=Spirodela intermedia TaxID=51605 RepID=A0A811G6M6_SPIIN|nr:unnamed protein product [Spirodela intermedia]
MGGCAFAAVVADPAVHPWIRDYCLVHNCLGCLSAHSRVAHAGVPVDHRTLNNRLPRRQHRLLHRSAPPVTPPQNHVPPMAQQTIEAHRPGAEIYTGDDLCRQKAIDLLEELNLPRGLLPIENVEEIGINRQTGFVWLRQKKALNYPFRKAGRLVSYGAEVTGFVEDRRMRRVTGVKSREMLIWIPLGEFFVNPKDTTKITFRTPAGLSKTYPASAFELEEQGNQRLLT